MAGTGGGRWLGLEGVGGWVMWSSCEAHVMVLCLLQAVC